MNEKAIKDILEGILEKVMEQLEGQKAGAPLCCDAGDSIPVEISARHAHLSEKDALTLFGGPLTPLRDLSQPGQFLCQERVRLIGPKGVIDNVAVLGPSRGRSQVEISKTDARNLGTDTPVRQSGDIAGTPGIILASQKSIVGLDEGLIVAARHIHMAPQDAERLHVSDKDLVSVRIDSERPVILEDVVVRVSDKFNLAMHIDLDEGNSSGWNAKVTGWIIGKNRETAHGLHSHRPENIRS
jgi:propanediol utilization protein